MKIVTTPMCQEILHQAGVSEFQVNSKGFYDDADIAFVLSETKISENSHTKFIKLKLNTFNQIKESITKVSHILGTEPLNKQFKFELENSYKRNDENRKIKIKVYSKFLKEIVEDMGFCTVTEDNYDFLVYPDYLKDKIKEINSEINFIGERAIEMPSHRNAPLNPIKRAEIRYQILETNICIRILR